MWYQKLLAGIVVLFTSTIFVVSSPTLAQSAQFVSEPCAFTIPNGAIVDCGTLTVTENRDVTNSGTIALAVAIYRSASADDADPLVFLQGGPGGGTIDTLNQVYGTFLQPLTQNRDVILLDQRGTGRSQPALNCSEVNQASLTDLVMLLTTDESAQLYQDAFANCSERLRAEGVDVSAFTSAENASDVAELIVALGYERADLYGASYGTRLALTVLRDHPQVVRSMVLDSAIPVEVNLYEQQAFKTDFALQRLFENCAVNSTCATAFPNLESDFYNLLDQLDRAPITVPVTNIQTGETVNAIVNGADFIGAMFFALQIPQLISDIPQMIVDTRDGYTDRLAIPLAVGLLLGDSINIGMFASTNCHEEVFASTPEEMEMAWQQFPRVANFAANAAFGSANALFEVCRSWGAAPFDSDEALAVGGDVPVLALAGELDPATPVVWTQQVASHFSNAYFYELPSQTHVVGLSSSCALDITQQFLSNPDVAPDDACIEDIPTIDFTIANNEATTDSLVLVAYQDADGWQSVVPDAWQMVQPGVFARASSITDPVLVFMGIAVSDPNELLGALLASIGINSIPDVSGTVQSEIATWSLYQASANGLKLDIALSINTSESYLVVLQSTLDDRSRLYESVFIPAIQGFRVE